jgi:hypothetical protein
MAIKKKAVAVAVSTAKAPKAESVSTKDQDWDKLLINSTEEESNSSSVSNKTYVNYMGKDRLLREAPGWGDAKGQIVQFVIYGSDENGNPLPDLPKTRFGSLADVEYCEKKYPMSKGYFVNDQVCRNGRHKIDIYKIHICGVRKIVEEVE